MLIFDLIVHHLYIPYKTEVLGGILFFACPSVHNIARFLLNNLHSLCLILVIFAHTLTIKQCMFDVWYEKNGATGS